MLRSGSSPSPTRQRAGHIACTTNKPSTFGLHEVFKCAQLTFTVYGRKQTYTQLPQNAVTLVWGSLRFAPIMQPCSQDFQKGGYTDL